MFDNQNFDKCIFALSGLSKSKIDRLKAWKRGLPPEVEMATLVTPTTAKREVKKNEERFNSNIQVNQGTYLYAIEYLELYHHWRRHHPRDTELKHNEKLAEHIEDQLVELGLRCKHRNAKMRSYKKSAEWLAASHKIYFTASGLRRAIKKLDIELAP